MRKKLGSLLICCLLAACLVVPTVNAASWEVECAEAAVYPQCNWCMTQCIFAVLADMWNGGGISWDWGIR